MSGHHETNPHFVRPSWQDDGQHPPDHLPRGTTPWGIRPQLEGRFHEPDQRRSRRQRQETQIQPRADPQPALAPLAPPRDHLGDQYYQRHPEDNHYKQRGPTVSFPRRDEDHPKQLVPYVPPTRHQGRSRLPHDSPETRPSHRDRDQQSRQQPQHNDVPVMPRPRKTKALTWLTAVVCAIFWIIIILGGLIVLIVYLVFRPRNPQFDVSTATLNAAYLDMGYLLNADLTMLANFTNPNKKASVDFSYMYIELYYGRTLIATQAIEPFSAPKAGTMFANLHMVTSQVRLSELEIQRLKRQVLNNEVMFDVKGFFRARSNFGGLLRYSYWLHGHCTIMVKRPPDGVIIAKKCRTKH